jgi:transcriptional antiterminator RfaH
MSFWAAVRLQPQRGKLALHCLSLAGFTTYQPLLRERRRVRGRWEDVTSALFPNYAFVLIQLQWHAAHYAAGVVGLILSAGAPARVPDPVIAAIRARERDGLVELPKPKLRRGDPVRVREGPFHGLAGLYDGQAPHQRVAVLLAFLGAQQRVILPKDDVEAVP